MADILLLCRRAYGYAPRGRQYFETLRRRATRYTSCSLQTNYSRGLSTSTNLARKKEPGPEAQRKNSPAAATPPPPKNPSLPTSPSSQVQPIKENATAKLVYPETLLVYHAGQAPTIFIATVKFAGIILWIGATFFVAPAYYLDPLEPTWMAPVASLVAAIPLAITVFAAPPLVTYVHLSLPIYARTSTTRLHRFASNLPSTTWIDITSMTWLWPRVTRLRASELYLPQREIAGQQVTSMTLHREIPPGAEQGRKWWMWRSLNKFMIAAKSRGKMPEQGIWEEVLTCVARGWQKRQPATPMDIATKQTGKP